MQEVTLGADPTFNSTAGMIPQTMSDAKQQKASPFSEVTCGYSPVINVFRSWSQQSNALSLTYSFNIPCCCFWPLLAEIQLCCSWALWIFSQLFHQSEHLSQILWKWSYHPPGSNKEQEPFLALGFSQSDLPSWQQHREVTHLNFWIQA